MDPLSQGLLGSLFASCFAKKQPIKNAVCCGAIGGMAADVDILINSSHDSLLAIEYHRHFSHSIFFIPFGGFLSAIFIWFIFFRKGYSFKFIYLFSTLGYATHGFLDSFTSYGTNLFWPISDIRISWSLISIIDPIFTLILLISLILAIYKNKFSISIYGTILAVSYLLFGFYQQYQVKNFIYDIADSRNHKIERIFLNPTIGNNLLWRSVYQSQGYYYVDAVRIVPISGVSFKEGKKIRVINKEDIFPNIPLDSTHRNDIKRFAYFSQDYIYIHPDYQNVIADLRYGTLPYNTKSLWGIKINPEDYNEHVKFISLRDFTREDYREFMDMIKYPINK